MKLKPTGKRLLIEKIESEKKTVIIVERNDEPYMARVVALGDKTEISAKEGDMLLMAPYSGFMVAKEEHYYVVNDGDVIGILS